MFIYIIPNKEPTTSQQDFIFSATENKTTPQLKAFINKNSDHPNQNHPLYEDEFEENFEQEIQIKELEPLLPYSRKNKSCYTFSSEDHVFLTDDLDYLHDINFNKFKALQIYKQEVTSEQIGHAIEMLRAYQAIANNDAINNDEWCLVMRNGLEVCDNFVKRIKGFTELNIVGNLIVLSDYQINNFNNFHVSGHTSNYRFHRYKEKTDCFFFSRGQDINFATSAILIRKSLATRIIKLSKQEGYYYLAGDLDLIDKVQLFPVYVRGVFVIDKKPILGYDLRPTYTGFSRIIHNFTLWLNAYYRQLRITSTLDTPTNHKHGF